MAQQFDFKTLGSPIEADWPVKINVPQDGGATQVQTLVARLRLLTEQQVKDFDAQPDAINSALKAAVVGFGAAEKTTFTPELLEQMLAVPYVKRALNLAYGEFSNGISVKN